MLGITLKETRVYQDIKEEGLEEGREEAHEEAREEMAKCALSLLGKALWLHCNKNIRAAVDYDLIFSTIEVTLWFQL